MLDLGSSQQKVLSLLGRRQCFLYALLAVKREKYKGAIARSNHLLHGKKLILKKKPRRRKGERKNMYMGNRGQI